MAFGAETTAWAKAQGRRVTEELGAPCSLARVPVAGGVAWGWGGHGARAWEDLAGTEFVLQTLWSEPAIHARTHSAHIPEHLLCAPSEESVVPNPLPL